MPVLSLWQNGRLVRIPFEGEMALSRVLSGEGISFQHPCGGRGVCGKCKVCASGAVSPPTKAEREAKARLSCQITLLGDCEITLADDAPMEQIETRSVSGLPTGVPMKGQIGAAVDIGTTTIALKVFDLKTGALLGEAAGVNPQIEIAADVMGRISHALAGEGDRLRQLVLKALSELIALAGFDQTEIDAFVVTGNTTMLYLLCGLSPISLATAPFEADNLFDSDIALFNGHCYIPRCMNAFVGADTTCACLASGMCERDETSLLVDIGTNGEIALWKGGRLCVTSTAAGPAFEGAGISKGMGASRGAVDKVWLVNGAIQSRVIGGGPALGLCGSGLIDAIAQLLRLGVIDETGAMDQDCEIAPGVTLTKRDVREAQLAKAAIAAGLDTLLDEAGSAYRDIAAFYIAGGFGNHIDLNSAARIGLFPKALRDKAEAAGNAALAGAQAILLNASLAKSAREIAGRSTHINLGGNPDFNGRYIDNMMFPGF